MLGPFRIPLIFSARACLALFGSKFADNIEVLIMQFIRTNITLLGAILYSRNNKFLMDLMQGPLLVQLTFLSCEILGILMTHWISINNLAINDGVLNIKSLIPTN